MKKDSPSHKPFLHSLNGKCGLGIDVGVLNLPADMSEPSIDYYNRAIDAVQAGKLPEALSAVETSLTEDPADIQTWQLYAVVLSSLGRTEDAAKAISKLRVMGLGEVDDLLMKAAGAAGSGDLKAAIGFYEAAIEADPQRSEIHASLSLALMQCDYTADALAAAERAVELAPDDAHANYALGHVLRLTEKKEAALAALTKAVSADPFLLIALYEQGMLLADAGRYQEALRNFEKFLAEHPGDPSATQAVASVRARMDGGRA